MTNGSAADRFFLVSTSLLYFASMSLTTIWMRSSVLTNMRQFFLAQAYTSSSFFSNSKNTSSLARRSPFSMSLSMLCQRDGNTSGG